MVLDIGEVEYAVAMCSAIDASGGVGNEIPDVTGDMIRFFAQKVEFPKTPKSQLKTSGNFQSTMIPIGNMGLGVKMSDLIVGKDDGYATATATVDAIEDFIRTAGVKIGGARVYCFAYNNFEGVYKKLGWNSSHARTNYLYGRPVPTTWEMASAAIYTAAKLEFWEVTIL